MFIKKLGLNLLTVEVQVVIRFGKNMYFLERHDRMFRIHLYDKHIEIPDEFRHHKNLVQLEWIHFGRPNDFYLLQVSLTSPAAFLPNVFLFRRQNKENAEINLHFYLLLTTSPVLYLCTGDVSLYIFHGVFP